MQQNEVVEDTAVVVPRMDIGGKEVKKDDPMNVLAGRLLGARHITEIPWRPTSDPGRNGTEV